MNIKYHFVLLIVSLFVVLISGCKEDELRKVDPELRLTLKSLKEKSQLDQQLSVMFKVNEDLTDLQLSILNKKEINIIANIGTIYTASLPAKRVIDLAKMKFVDAIQGAKQARLHSPDSIKSKIKIEEIEK